MPVSRQHKSEQLDEYRKLIAGSEAMVVADYRGLTVPQLQKLRRNLREHGASFVIAKKTLLSLALTESGKPVPKAALAGPVGFVFLGQDLAASIKVLKDFSKETGDLFHVLGGVLGPSVLDSASALALADLPSREVQLGQLLGAISAPMSTLLSLITGPHRDLIGLLQARIDKESDAVAA